MVRACCISKYLMSPYEAGYEGGQRWRRAVQFRRDVYADEREEIEKTDLPASDPFHPDPVDRLCAAWNAEGSYGYFVFEVVVSEPSGSSLVNSRQLDKVDGGTWCNGVVRIGFGLFSESKLLLECYGFEQQQRSSAQVASRSRNRTTVCK